MLGNLQPIRVLIVDDSLFMRKALSRLIEEGNGLTVVGMAGNGHEALACLSTLTPDVVIMDLQMPEMDGLTALQHIMQRHPLPVVIFSSLSKKDAEITLKCLELGAVDFICKPAGGVGGDLASIRYIIWQKLRGAAHATMQHQPLPAVLPQALPLRREADAGVSARVVVTIGASTGGPRALMDLLAALPGDLPAGVVVVQHMPANFTAAMANRLDSHCQLNVHEAQENDVVQTGHVLIAPGGKHLHLQAPAQIHLSDEPPLWGVRPAVDLMMHDCAVCFGPTCLGVVLTGMGHDGTAGLMSIKQAGGSSLVQDEESCVVYGMPRSAVEAGVADEVLPITAIPRRIVEWCRTMEKSLSREFSKP